MISSSTFINKDCFLYTSKLFFFPLKSQSNWMSVNKFVWDDSDVPGKDNLFDLCRPIESFPLWIPHDRLIGKWACIYVYLSVTDHKKFRKGSVTADKEGLWTWWQHYSCDRMGTVKHDRELYGGGETTH